MVRQFSGNVLDGHIIKAAAVQHFSRGLSPGKIGHTAHFRIFVEGTVYHAGSPERQQKSNDYKEIRRIKVKTVTAVSISSALLGEKFSLYIGIGIALILSATIIITLSASQSAFRRGMQKNSA